MEFIEQYKLRDNIKRIIKVIKRLEILLYNIIVHFTNFNFKERCDLIIYAGGGYIKII